MSNFLATGCHATGHRLSAKSCGAPESGTAGLVRCDAYDQSKRQLAALIEVSLLLVSHLPLAEKNIARNAIWRITHSLADRYCCGAGQAHQYSLGNACSLGVPRDPAHEEIEPRNAE